MSKRWLLLCMLGAAFILRLFVALYFGNEIFWEDETDYIDLSQKILWGDYTNQQDDPTAFRPPGYPMFLSILSVMFFKTPVLIRIAQTVLGLYHLLILYRFVFVMWGRNVATWSLLIAAFYPYYLLLPATILPTLLASTMLALATLCGLQFVNKNRYSYLIFSLLTWGMLILVRPSNLVLFAAFMLWLVVSVKFPFKKKVYVTIMGTVIVGALILPWMVRNHQTLGTFSLSTNTGRNLWLGNNPLATVNTGSNIERPDFLDEKLAGITSEKEIDSIYKNQAMENIKSDPGFYAKLFVKKMIWFWRLDPSPTTGGYVTLSNLLKIVSIIILIPLYGLAIWSFFIKNDPHPINYLFVFYFISFTLLHAIFFVKVRFRLPLDQFVIMLAAVSIVNHFEKLYRNTKA